MRSACGLVKILTHIIVVALLASSALSVDKLLRPSFLLGHVKRPVVDRVFSYHFDNSFGESRVTKTCCYPVLHQDTPHSTRFPSVYFGQDSSRETLVALVVALGAPAAHWDTFAPALLRSHRIVPSAGVIP